jgi:hypothetical protein
MSLEALLAGDSIVVEQPKATVDDSGGFVVSPWDPVASDVPARVEAADGGLREMYAAQGMIVTHVVYTQLDAIRQGMRITTSDGLYLLVEGVMKQRQLGTIPTYYQIAAKQVQL